MENFNESSSYVSFFKMVYVLIVFIIILGISYYFSRFIAKRIGGKNKYMKHIETISFGNDKNIHIVQICDAFYLISSSQKGICLLEKLPDNILKDESCDINCKQESASFESYLEHTYDNEGFNKRYNIKQNIEKLKKIVKGNRTDE